MGPRGENDSNTSRKLGVESKRLSPLWKRREKLERDCRRRRDRAGKCHKSRICISVQAA